MQSAPEIMPFHHLIVSMLRCHSWYRYSIYMYIYIYIHTLISCGQYYCLVVLDSDIDLYLVVDA